MSSPLRCPRTVVPPSLFAGRASPPGLFSRDELFARLWVNAVTIIPLRCRSTAFAIEPGKVLPFARLLVTVWGRVSPGGNRRVTLLLIRVAVWGRAALVTALPALTLVFVNRAVEDLPGNAIRHKPGRGPVAAWLQRASGGVFTISGTGIQ